MRKICISMEAEGVQEEQEDEITLYAKIGDHEGLRQAYEAEMHIQAEVKGPAGRIRVRKTTPWHPGTKGPAGPDVFELTTKFELASGAVQSNKERTKVIDRETCEQFISVCDVYQSKTRYCFRIEKLVLGALTSEVEVEVSDLKYEVDVYDLGNGERSEWCKIDIELGGLGRKLKEHGLNLDDLNIVVRISKLPFLPFSIVLDDRNGDKDKAELIQMLYNTQFLLKVPDYYRQ